MAEEFGEARRWQDRLNGRGVDGWTVGISNLTRAFAERYPNADDGDIRYLENLVDLVRRYLETSDPRRVTESMLNELGHTTGINERKLVLRGQITWMTSSPPTGRWFNTRLGGPARGVAR